VSFVTMQILKINCSY